MLEYFTQVSFSTCNSICSVFNEQSVQIKLIIAVIVGNSRRSRIIDVSNDTPYPKPRTLMIKITSVLGLFIKFRIDDFIGLFI